MTYLAALNAESGPSDVELPAKVSGHPALDLVPAMRGKAAYTEIASMTMKLCAAGNSVCYWEF